MEIELKYNIPSHVIITDILEDEFILSNSDAKRWEVTPMSAIYYDTNDRALLKEKIALRLRKEGKEYMATVKTGGIVNNGLHQREEINVPLNKEGFEAVPTLEIFKNLPIGKTLEKVIKKEPIEPIMAMKFSRNAIKVKRDNTIVEVAIDQGNIIVGDRISLIRELEVELYQGDKELLMEIGEFIKAKYSLEEESDSKFKRGMELMGKVQDMDKEEAK